MTPLLVCVGSVAIVAVLLGVARKLIPGEVKAAHHDVAAAMFSMVGVLYAVLLAFVVVVVWQGSTDAGNDSQIEANDLSRIYFTARALPEPQRDRLTALARDYADEIVTHEWALLREGSSSAQARSMVAQMRVQVQSMQPTTMHDQMLMNASLDAINSLVEARRARVAAAASPIQPIMWIGLVLGSVVTIGFSFLFDHSRFSMHLLMVGAMTVLIAFTLWLIQDMSQPFNGLTALEPDPFRAVLQRFNEFP